MSLFEEACIFPSEITVGDKEYTILKVSYGCILTKEQFLEEYQTILDILEKAKEFHLDQSHAELIKRHNFKILYAGEHFTSMKAFKEWVKENDFEDIFE
jgi:hypothetical protein